MVHGDKDSMSVDFGEELPPESKNFNLPDKDVTPNVVVVPPISANNFM